MEEEVVAGRYRVGRKIGAGAYGQLYAATDERSREQVAIKFESVRAKNPRLAHENQAYNRLGGGNGMFPKVRWYGRSGQHYALVMDLLGDSLEKVFKQCGRRLSLKTVLMLADQMLDIMEYMHSKSYIHRDIKPDNFVTGLGNRANQVYLIDFGLAKKFRDSSRREHIPYGERNGFVGTPRYASINSHDGIELSRRDDLESLGYLFVYLLRGRLPWDHVVGTTPKDMFNKMRDKKVVTNIEKLCHGLPPEFKNYFRYVHALRFDEGPDYTFLKRMFRDLFAREGFRHDNVYDWTNKRKASNSGVRPPSREHRPPRPSRGHDKHGDCSRCSHHRKTGAWSKVKKFFS